MISPGERAIYVRVPEEEAERLDRVSFELKLPKRELIRDLLVRHLDDVAGEPSRRVVLDLPDEGLTVGRHEFRPAPAPEVLTLADVAELLSVDEATVRELAEAAELPGRRLGEEWRFSRAAILNWLGGG